MKRILVFCLVICMVAACFVGCTKNVQTESPEETAEAAVAASTTEEPEPTEQPEESALKVAFIMSDTLENTYNKAMYLSLEKLAASGENFEYVYAEKTTADTAESVIRTYCDAGYDVILCHAGITRDAGMAVAADYPDVYFLGGGNSWETDKEPNVGAYDQATHEACYLLGVLAAKVTQSNVIGYVGAMELANITSEVNAYTLGAQSVNPDIEVLVSYINSWYDPVTAKESANAQIAKGADVIFGERDGVLDACIEAGIYALCDKTDQIEANPDTMLGCAVCMWDTSLKEAFDAIRAGNFENRYYTTYEGAIAGGYTDAVLNEALIPADVLAEVEAVRAQIVSGELVVPYNP